MTFTIQNIIQQLEAKFYGSNCNFKVENVVIDSRSLQNNKGTLFFALKGNNHNAHSYIKNVIEKGVRYFVVESIPEDLQGKANFLVVKDTQKALQETAKYYRNLFSFPIIGITGSNGKTIVKEWLNFLLSPNYVIVRSPKSYNSQVGVPLSIFGINEQHNLGIFEAGISQMGEMSVLEKIIQPTIGVFTHLGKAHDEGFNNQTEKIKEKIKLFKHSEIVILERDVTIESFITQPKFTWSFKDKSADVYLELEAKNKVRVTFAATDFYVELPFIDKSSIENAVCCIAIFLYLKTPIPVIQDRIAHLFPVETRLEAKRGINNCLLIDDSYSSDYQSLKIALDFLEQQKQHQTKTIILSDIFQSGLPTKKLYEKVSKVLLNNNIDRIIAIGETISYYLKDMPNTITFSSTAVFLQQFNTQSFQNETLLIKGARNFNFDEIVVLLEEKKHETVLEINLNALTHNLNFYKHKLKPTTKVMAMVKAFGYGSGGYELAKFLEYQKIDFLGVAFADEGIELRKAGITLPIMVLNPEISSYTAMIAYDLEPEIYTLEGLFEFIKIARKKNIDRYPIHIKIDSGMHRLGFEKHQLAALVSELRATNIVQVKSVFSHLATSDDTTTKAFTQMQFNRYMEAYSIINKELNYTPIRHILNTSGVFNYPEFQLDMVRLGIGLYGIGNAKEENKKLQNVSTLKSVISQIREIEPHESIGYGRKFVASSQMRVATIPIGYADGIRRAWGNEKGYVIIANKKATILGNICMDMLMVDVSKISCSTGDEVVVFGGKPSVIEMAKVVNTIPYEILTGISQRVKRVFYQS